MRITIVTASLAAGGAERAAVNMSGYWARKHEVTVITVASQDTDVYRLDDRVRRVALGVMSNSSGVVRAVAANLNRLLVLRKSIALSRPDIVVALTDRVNIMALLAMFRQSLPVIVVEQIDPLSYSPGHQWERLRRFAYPHAAAVIVLASQQQEWAERLVRREKIAVIPNPIARLVPSGSYPVNLPKKPFIVAMGRLNRQKGFDILIPVFARIVEKLPDWNLLILGEGPERKNLERLAADLGIANRILMPGTVEHPADYLLGAEFFVMPSRFEGFPLALCEAMGCGLPAVAFDCRTGPRDIVRHEEDGLLLPPEDAAALYGGMLRLCENQELREKMGQKAIEVLERFSVDSVMAKYDRLLDRVLEQRK